MKILSCASVDSLSKKHRLQNIFYEGYGKTAGASGFMFTTGFVSVLSYTSKYFSRVGRTPGVWGGRRGSRRFSETKERLRFEGASDMDKGTKSERLPHSSLSAASDH